MKALPIVLCEQHDHTCPNCGKAINFPQQSCRCGSKFHWEKHYNQICLYPEGECKFPFENKNIVIEGYGNISLFASEYSRNKRLAIQAYNKDGFLFNLTTNLPEHPLEEGEFFVKTWSENAPFIKGIMDMGFFEDTSKKVRTGFVNAPIWRIKK